MSTLKRGFYFGVKAAKKAANTLLSKGAKTEKARVIISKIRKEKDQIVKDYMNQVQKSAKEFLLLTQKETERLLAKLNTIEKKAVKKKKR
ncbi:hypothetical protein HYX19_04715 [Candidatus Woesearchaeota archaeon]|nr:hypothetical protein [Candidatus Woesearchaeota archaeon]